MWTNLFLSYELKNAATDCEKIDKAIQQLGNSTKLHASCWYVNSEHSADEAVKRIGRLLTQDDILIVIDSSNDVCSWFNLEEKRQIRVKQNWKLNKASAASS